MSECSLAHSGDVAWNERNISECADGQEKERRSMHRKKVEEVV